MECFAAKSIIECIACQDKKGGCGFSSSINEAFDNKSFEECDTPKGDCSICNNKVKCFELRDNLNGGKG